MITAAALRVAAGQHLSMSEMTGVVDAFMQGQADDEAVGRFLLALRAKGETVEEIAGAAAAMRRHMTPIRSNRSGVLDTCGTGGDGSHTFNISTAAALVTAACDVPVAKHGNRSITSRSGSADVLAALGVNIESPVARVEQCLQEVGICFCFAPQLHPAMRHLAAVRRRLGVPTIFNMLGPLCNPASAPFHLLGVGRPELRGKLSAALALLGAERAVVVCGDDGLDEVTLAGRTQVTLVERGALREFAWSPEQFEIPESPLDTLRIDSPEASAAMIQEILAGRPGPARDIVVLNAAAALWTARRCATPAEGARLAATAIDTGGARRRLEELVAFTNR